MWSMTCSRATRIQLRRARRHAPLVWLAAAGLASTVALAQSSPPPVTEPIAEPVTVPAPPAETSAPAPTTQDPVAASEARVKSVEVEVGRNTLRTAEAYFDLAEAKRAAGEHDEAATSYLAAIDIYRAVDGAFTPLAIGPLTSLGDNYHEAGDYLSAVSAYGEARTISRRAYGLMNERQVVFLDRLSRSLLELNQTIEADEQQTESLRIVERNHPPESDEALAALYKYAGWLRDRGFFQTEREQYLRALRTVREHYGKEDVRQVAPLVGLANSLRNQRLPDGLGIGSLQEALRLLQAAPEQDQVAIAAVMRDIGDWFVAFNRVGYDGAEYRQAWELLGNAPNGEQLRQEWFTGPTYVLREPISLRGLSEEPNAPQGHVLVSFDLGISGESANVAVVESTPAGLKDEAMLRHIRRSRFRPQMANGELVPVQGLALQFNFRYMPDAVATND
jgi:tetratricopeptide (TPR) repeat protein